MVRLEYGIVFGIGIVFSIHMQFFGGRYRLHCTCNLLWKVILQMMTSSRRVLVLRSNIVVVVVVVVVAIVVVVVVK